MTLEEIITAEDRVRSDVAALLGDCVWSLGYDRAADCLQMELSRHLDDDTVEELCAQLTCGACYKGEGSCGSLFELYF